MTYHVPHLSSKTNYLISNKYSNMLRNSFDQLHPKFKENSILEDHGIRKRKKDARSRLQRLATLPPQVFHGVLWENRYISAKPSLFFGCKIQNSEKNLCCFLYPLYICPVNTQVPQHFYSFQWLFRELCSQCEKIHL